MASSSSSVMSSPASQAAVSSSSSSNALSSSSSLLSAFDLKQSMLLISLFAGQTLAANFQSYMSSPIPTLILIFEIVAVAYAAHAAVLNWQPKTPLAANYRDMCLVHVQFVMQVVVSTVGNLATAFLAEIQTRSASWLEQAVYPLLWLFVIVVFSMMLFYDSQATPEQVSPIDLLASQLCAMRARLAQSEAELATLKRHTTLLQRQLREVQSQS